jgi:hypothetical protein
MCLQAVFHVFTVKSKRIESQVTFHEAATFQKKFFFSIAKFNVDATPCPSEQN